MTEVFAHRGWTDGHVENTVEACLAARQQGADGVELDVRRSADGVLVLHHDATLPGGRLVCETPAAWLPAHVPRLADALAACEGLAVNVEIKNSPGDPGYEADQAIAVDVARAIAGSAGPTRVFASSFSPLTLEAVHRADPGRAVAWLLGWADDPPETIAEAVGRGFQALNPFVSSVDRALVDRIHAAGLGIHAWTVNAPADLRSMVTLGVDAVITDRAAEALAIAGRPR